MRNPILLLLLGVVVGAAAATSVVNMLRQRDAYPRGVMDVMQHHFAALRESVRTNRCKDQAAAHLQPLRMLAGEIETAVYPDDDADSPFREYARRLRDALAAVPADAECKALAPALDKVGAACEACHREYR